LLGWPGSTFTAGLDTCLASHVNHTFVNRILVLCWLDYTFQCHNSSCWYQLVHT
jgi:hypothetical protein